MEKLEIRHLQVFCKNVPILKDISITMRENQVIALIGPSGCGKSTFLKALNRMNEEEFEAVTKGEVFFMGENIYHPKVNKSLLRKKIGMIFQQPNPFPMTIYDNIAYGPRIHGIKKKEKLNQIVEQSLWQAGIWEEVKDFLYEKPDRFSGGQKQRICIARALAVEPDVLLMDEPTSALDPKSTEKIEQLILDLKKQKTIVLVTHNLKQAERISDETAFFKEGTLIENGKTRLLFSRPQKKETKNYLKAFI